MVSKIVYPNGSYVKAYCEGYLNDKEQVCLKMSGICESEEVTIHDMDLPYEVLFGICKVIFVKGVVPLYKPLNLIKTFEDFCEICIFPFFAFINDSQSQTESEREFDQMMDHSISEFAAEH